MRRHVGFKRFYGLGAHLLCTGMWVLSDFMFRIQPLRTGMWVLSDVMLWDSTFVHRRVGFKRFYALSEYSS